MINLNMLCLHGDLYLSAWSNRIAMELEQEKIDTVAAKKMRKGFSSTLRLMKGRLISAGFEWWRTEVSRSCFDQARLLLWNFALICSRFSFYNFKNRDL